LHFNKEKISKIDKIYRSNLINSIVGIKQASLIGTHNKNNITNLAIFSSVVHLGSNPALIGLFTRPITDPPKQTLNNIISEGCYTINHVNKNIIDRSHCTSFKFLDRESEFKECGLNETYIDNFTAPFVKESRVSIGLNYIRKYEIDENGVIMIIGSISHILINEKYIQDNGEIDLSYLENVGVSGNNTYYETSKIKTLNYLSKKDKISISKIVSNELSKS
tara:strand:+ start:8632 stop:9294 length:663 start_codon:yes stop_codon:yes gene_type:complete